MENKWTISGNLITAIANKIRNYLSPPQNLIPTSTDSDGNIYNVKGFKENTRINSQGEEVSYSDIAVTGFIPCAAGETFNFTGFSVDAGGIAKIALYDSNKGFLASETFGGIYTTHTIGTESARYARFNAVFGENSTIKKAGGEGTSYLLAEMPSAVDTIYSKGYEDGEASATPSIEALSVTENGTYTAHEGIDGYSPISVNVPQGITPSGTKEITENGTYDVTEFASALVNVSGGGSSIQSGTVTAPSPSQNHLTIPVEGTISMFLLYRPNVTYDASVVGFFLRLPQGSCISGRFSHSSSAWTTKTDGTAVITEGSITITETHGFGFTAGTYNWIAL